MYSCIRCVFYKYYTPRTDRDLNHLVSHLTLRKVVQDLHRTDPILWKHVPDHANHTDPVRRHELDHMYKIEDRSTLKHLDHEVEIDYLSEVCIPQG